MFSYAEASGKTFCWKSAYALIQKIDGYANKGGRVRIEAHGVENIPREDGFIFYPNHQGMYDVLSIIQTCPRPFSVVMKKELSNIFFLKTNFRASGIHPNRPEGHSSVHGSDKGNGGACPPGKKFSDFCRGNPFQGTETILMSSKGEALKAP